MAEYDPQVAQRAVGGRAEVSARGGHPRKLMPFYEALKRALEVDAQRPKHARRSALALYTDMRAAGYAGVTRA